MRGLEKFNKPYLGGAPNSARPVGIYATVFDGATNLLTRVSPGFTGSADGGCFLQSFYVMRTDALAEHRISSGSSGKPPTVTLPITTGLLTLSAKNPAGTTVITAAVTSPAIAADGLLHHVAISCDLSVGTRHQIYIDRAPATVVWTAFEEGETIEFTANITIGGGAGPATVLKGKLAAWYFHTPAAFYDLSVAANLDALAPADNVLLYDPVTGALQSGDLSGVQPLCMLPLRANAPGTNLGSGGNMTAAGTFTGAQGPRTVG